MPVTQFPISRKHVIGRVSVATKTGCAMIAIAVALSGATSATAQQADPPPPTSIDTQSPGGVNLSTGSFSDRAVDLQIGGEGAEGLTLVRIYDSANSASYSTWAGMEGGPGWTHNWAQRITNSWVPKEDEFEPRCDVTLPQSFVTREDCVRAYTYMIHSAVAGDASFKFQNVDHGEYPSNSGANVGTFQPVEDSAVGASFVFTGAETTGQFTLTDKSGAVYVYLPEQPPTGMALDHLTYPDGTKVEITYDAFRPKSIVNSRGYAIILEHANGPQGGLTLIAACAINLAVEELAPAANCPAGADEVQYNYGTVQITQKRTNKPTVYFNRSALTSAINLAGAQTTYTYDDGGHVSCITDPGQSSCRVQINYNECHQSVSYEPGAPNAIVAEMHLVERVMSQVYADGSRYDYSYFSNGTYGATMECPDQYDDGFPKSGTYSFEDTNDEVTTVDLFFGRPTKITDPLGRITEQDRSSIVPSGTHYFGAAGVVTGHDLPDDKRLEWTYDNRGNQLTARRVTADGQSWLEYSATYPSTCPNPKTCNQPTATTDPNGKVTNFVYDASHGGVLKVTGPADDNGVRPETRYSYVQKYAWLKSGSGFVQASTPVWVLASEETCRTSSADSNGNCAAGSNDKVTTTYEYQAGSSTKGSNILRVGAAVTAGGQTLRTCYGYDDRGRQIFETQPNAGLASCQ